MPITPPRLHIVQRLRQELLGPKGGPEEVLEGTTDPREEYTTGVLDSPQLEVTLEESLELLESSDLSGLGESNGEDDEPLDPLLMAAEFAPSVDPRRLPCSIGLSFVLDATNPGQLAICVSGGRYRKDDKQWKRRSCSWTLDPLERSSWNEDFQHPEFGFRVVVRSRPWRNGSCRVSIYLLNMGSWQGQSRERASRFLYQPQIRVRLLGDLLAEGMLDQAPAHSADEEARLQFLYRNSPVKARGHLCGAVWREIDPEHEPDSPFGWVDQSPECVEFQDCDLRTELLPLAAVATPFVDWRSDLGPEPERSALALSECSSAELGPALVPLLNAYERWLELRKQEAQSLSEDYLSIATENLRLCDETLARMKAGIELLKEDPEAHLAFAFANRAVHLQASWSSERSLIWRPFQLGFILQCLPGLTDPNSKERDICDLLWFPTGGGKTEAYLALTAYVLGLRRLRHKGYDGVGVISRYTLRLLSIQQFRRALKLVTACEMLRVRPSAGVTGWRPASSDERRDFLWGEHRFSAGLWLGGAVTPNRLSSIPFPASVPGGFDILKGKSGESEPAQVTECPVCSSVLALPEQLESRTDRPWIIYLRLSGCQEEPSVAELSTIYIEVMESVVSQLTDSLFSLKLVLRPVDAALSSANLDHWWTHVSRLYGSDCQLLSARASRPGYFISRYTNSKGKSLPWNIELYCPNPDCATGQNPWREKLPLTVLGDPSQYQMVHPAVRSQDDPTVALSCPIPALMVDDQLYAWPPSLLVSTVDKFARLAFEPRAAALFGNVEYYHSQEGFYRMACARLATKDQRHPPRANQRIEVPPLPPPDLVVQDELHLIDGPLGSMVGLYETLIQALCGPKHRLKYIASTATVREAKDQVQALFTRELRQFPPPSLDADDSFFALLPKGEVLQRQGAGRLYMGYSAPGRGALTPQVRAWAVLLQAAQELKSMGISDEELDPYWSPVGYFTAIRQLASAAGLWRQAIPLRLQYLDKDNTRELSSPLELSSRVPSHRLPNLLARLSEPLPGAVDGVLSTSMFGTGVDVSRLSLMLVQGQPKTTSAYIQATGRVGRQSPGLIITALPAANPRALDHYEFFTGYHHQLYRGVEPVTVYPFAPRARERALGPLLVALLRQLREVNPAWRERETGARLMADAWNSPEVQRLARVFEERAQAQPELRRPDLECLTKEVEQALTAWKELAERRGSELRFEEYTLAKQPSSPVVLGDPQHATANLPMAFPNTPQSLREIEMTTGFRI